MTDGGRRGDSKYRSAARIARLGARESARGPDADRHVKLLIQFAVEGSLSGAYSHIGLACFGQYTIPSAVPIFPVGFHLLQLRSPLVRVWVGRCPVAAEPDNVCATPARVP